jgi:murein DD-endopeptidase MepM/ murein hydrolase activator NlpD
MFIKRKVFFFTPLLVLPILYILGCSTTPNIYPPSQLPILDSSGIYHTVTKGQTLWGISKQYGVDLEQLTKINRILDNRSIEVGQKIFIPDKLRDKVLEHQYSVGDDFIWPVKGRVVCPFGATFKNMVNKGLILTPYDSGDVLASRSGRVVFLGKKFAGLEATLIIDHADGFFTVYGVNSDIFVKPGEMVKRGTVISRISTSGKNAYLHFEIRKGQTPQNPTFYLS